jgi:hypothetical protein
VHETCSGLCPMVGFGICSIEPSGAATTEFVESVLCLISINKTYILQHVWSW